MSEITFRLKYKSVFVYISLSDSSPLCNEQVFTPNIKSATSGYNLNFNILARIFPPKISIKHSGKNNDLTSEEKVYDVTVRLLKEILDIFIFLDFQFGNICVSRCVEKIPWLGYTRFNNILTCPPPHVRLALWVNNPVRVC